MLDNGIVVPPSQFEAHFLSIAHTKKELDRTLEVMEMAFKKMVKKMPNKFFPVSIDLNNKNILVIGAGKIALRKVKTLLDYNCNITVITKEISEEEFLELEKENKIKILKNQEFEEKFLKGFF